MDNELLALDSYETRIRQARSALGRAKNYSLGIVPINSLPSEILSRIFGLVLNDSCRGYEKPGSLVQQRFPKYPDVFLHVCSRWRQVATTACMLWSHIDLITRYCSTTGYLARAETFVALAGQYPLQLHITGADEPGPDLHYLFNTDTPLLQFLSSIAPRIQSIELVTYIFTYFHLSMLQACFVNCAPRTLTQLIMQTPHDSDLSSDSRFGFVEAMENARAPNSLRVDVQQERLEALWLPVKILYLCGIYPHWTSKAYHGLVELRLLGVDTNEPITITESELVGILEGSPQLRVLHLGMTITECLPKYASVTPVCLDSLQVVDLSATHSKQNGTILRWLAPGPEPPIVALNCKSPSTTLPDDETQHFLHRSRATKLAVTGHDSNNWPPNLLSLSPHLEVLVFKLLSYCVSTNTVLFPTEHDPPPVSFRPNHLHVVLWQCIIDLGWLLQVLERRPIKMITLWGCDAQRNAQTVSQSEVQHELSQICPIVKILDCNEPSPIMDWYLLD